MARLNNLRPEELAKGIAIGEQNTTTVKADEKGVVALSSPINQTQVESSRIGEAQESKQQLKKAEPLLDRENFVGGHFKKFLAHVETR